METTQVSINRQMDKEDVIYLYNGILLHPEKTKYCHVQQRGGT